MIFCARATRGLRITQGSRQTVLLARRTPTIKRWSLDARSGRPIQATFLERIRASLERLFIKWSANADRESTRLPLK